MSLALAAVIALVGCAQAVPAAPAPAAGSDETTSEGTGADENGRDATARATAVIGGESYEFELALCMIQSDAVLAYGGGQDSSGAPVFLDVDLVIDGADESGGARLEIGTDQRFDSRDEFLSVTAGMGDAHTLTVDGSRFTLEGVARHAGEDSMGAGTITADCG